MDELVRDYVLAVDASSSMLMKLPDGRSRWQAVAEATFGLAVGVEELDPDGIEVYTFSSKVKEWENASSETIVELFAKNKPFGSTNLTGLLDVVLLQKWKTEVPTTLLVITDGEPNDKAAVANTIIEATKRMQFDEQLAVSFIQVGNDPAATRFLQFLDDDLVDMGARFDIVDTVPVDAFGDRSLEDILLAAIHD